ncbi:MAG: S66 peptidase family protein [Jatrophihabitans sp.]
MSESLRRPPALQPGDRVAVLSSSSPVNPDLLPDGLAALRFAGLDPVVYPSARDGGSMRGYLAGDDALRSNDLRSALLDDSIAGILFACGGSGSQRTLEALDWTGLDGIEPKVLVGFSDVTAVLEAVAVKLGWASVHGPVVIYGDRPSHASLLRTLLRPAEAVELDFPDAKTAVAGTARGVTMGGNLCLLMASIGTDTSWSARGGILLLEDESEDDYRIDRMLTHLRRSGYLDGVAGIVCGHWDGCGEPEAIEAILAERLGDLGAPMITGVPIGHGGQNQAWPIGIAAELDADARTVRLLDPPLVPAG